MYHIDRGKGGFGGELWVGGGALPDSIDDLYQYLMFLCITSAAVVCNLSNIEAYCVFLLTIIDLIFVFVLAHFHLDKSEFFFCLETTLIFSIFCFKAGWPK